MRRVVLDSNIYISALVFGGKPKLLFEQAVMGEIEVAISAWMLEEVRRHLRKKFGWSEERIREVERLIALHTTRVTPTDTLDVVKDDPDDNRILECAVAAGSDVIVSGDGDLLRLGRYGGITIQSVADFLSPSRRR